MCYKGGLAISGFLNGCKGVVTHDGKGKPVKINAETGLPKMPRGFLRNITKMFGEKTKQPPKENDCNISDTLDVLDGKEVALNFYGIPVIAK